MDIDPSEQNQLHAGILTQNSSGNFKALPASSPPLSNRAYEVCMEIPRESGKGMIRKIKMQRGISLVVMNYKVFKPFVSKNNHQGSLFGFRFSLSGRAKMHLNCLKTDLDIRKGQSGVFYFPDICGLCEDTPGNFIRRVSIQMDPRFFNELMENELQTMAAPLHTFRRKIKDPFDSVDTITSPMRTVLEQIISCPYQGAVRRLFLEGKVMELIAYKLQQLGGEKNIGNGCFSLKPDEMDRIQEAGDILIKNFQNPPGLSELSGLVGLSRSKLISLFKSVHGTSPAGFIRNLRLEKGRRLLETGKMNVTETAYFVGFSSLSHFALVFRQYYGTAPSRFYQKKPH